MATRRTATSTNSARRRSSPRRAHSSPASRDPAPVDHRRYLDFRAGVPAAELATRENVRLPTIEASIQRVISHNAQFSQEQAEIAARQLFLQAAPTVAQALTSALTATKTRTRKELVLRRDPMTGTEDWIETENEIVEPDHKTQLSAVDTWKSLPGAASPRQPGVMVDARTQVNNGGGQVATSALAASSGGVLSAESLIRQIRQQRGLDTVDTKLLIGGDVAAEAERDIDLDEIIAEEEEAALDADQAVQRLSQPVAG